MVEVKLVRRSKCFPLAFHIFSFPLLLFSSVNGTLDQIHFAIVLILQ